MAIEATTPANAVAPSRAYGALGLFRDAGQKAADRPQGRLIEDRLELSDTARETTKLLAALPPMPDILASFEENAAAFSDQLGNKFRAMGIDTSRPIELAVGSNGQVRVANGHPDKDRIEAMFAQDPEFANRFRELIAATEIKKAVDDHMAFSKAYEQDPQAAIARFSHLFSDQPSSEVRYRFDGTDLTASFVDKAAVSAR